MNIEADFSADGYAVARRVLNDDQANAWRRVVDRLATASDGRGLLRNVLADPKARALAGAPALRRLLALVGSPGAQPVRGIVFDKQASAAVGGSTNWGVGWHQDTVIAVDRRVDLAPAGFGAWSEKAGVPHLVAPPDVLERMVTLRLALDKADERRGALQVAPGSHQEGILVSAAIEERRRRRPPVSCDTAVGDVVAMRPLLLHASSKATAPGRRRVVHLEYATAPLSAPLAWPRWEQRSACPARKTIPLVSEQVGVS